MMKLRWPSKGSLSVIQSMTHITSLHFKNVNFLSFPRSSVGMPTPALQRRLTDRWSGQDSYHAGAWEPEKTSLL